MVVFLTLNSLFWLYLYSLENSFSQNYFERSDMPFLQPFAAMSFLLALAYGFPAMICAAGIVGIFKSLGAIELLFNSSHLYYSCVIIPLILYSAFIIGVIYKSSLE